MTVKGEMVEQLWERGQLTPAGRHPTQQFTHQLLLVAVRPKPEVENYLIRHEMHDIRRRSNVGCLKYDRIRILVHP